MRPCSRFVVAGIALSAWFAAFHANAADEQMLSLLIVTGANNHNWRATTPVLVKTLEGSARFTVDVSDDPAAPVLNEADLRQYDVVLLNYNGPRWEAQREQALVEFVRRGGGLVVVHAANNPFRDWKEFNEMIGVGWREGAGHGAPHAFPVEITDREHPITRGMPPRIAHVEDELYHNLTGPMLGEKPPPHTKYHLLARAFSERSTGGTGKHEPMALTVEYHQGRVFHTSMGHFPASMADPCFRAFVTRGAEWAATGEVTLALPEELAETQ